MTQLPRDERVFVPDARAEARTILLTGATGYVGRHLLQRLEAAGLHRVRCMTRHPARLRERVNPKTEVVYGDVLDPASLTAALHGVDTAYYLVHSMDGPGDFEALDRAGAGNFARAARAAGVGRIVYLGGLGAGTGLSSHLASRQEVGGLLRSSGVPTVEFRASIIIGPGSASYEIVRTLVENLPVLIAPRWIDRGAQPIAIADVIDYLLAALDLPRAGHVVFEIGGADRVTYAEVIREYARQRGLRRRLIRLPAMPEGLVRPSLALVTPAHARVAAAMFESLRHDTVVRTPGARRTFPVRPRGMKESIARALSEEDHQFAEAGRRLVFTHSIRVDVPAPLAFAPIQRIGGRTGWYAADWFWHLRGALDVARGGTGLRRGRRDQLDLRVGEAVDFWRVERLEPDRMLRLTAEMKIPGRLWLQFEVDPGERGSTHIRQTTVFDPAGYVGRAYWRIFYPVHHLVFGSMLRGIGRTARRAEAAATGAAAKRAAATA